MKKRQGKRHTPEQIIKKLREADTMLAVGRRSARWFKSWKLVNKRFIAGDTSTAV